MGNQKTDNHYVPQSYLKNWSTDGKLLTYRLLVPHENCELWKGHSTRSIAKHQHLYTYFSGAADSDEVECWLDRDFESPATSSIAKVVREEQLTPGDWNNLFRFALAQSVRPPAGMQQFFDRQSKKHCQPCLMTLWKLQSPGLRLPQHRVCVCPLHLSATSRPESRSKSKR